MRQWIIAAAAVVALAGAAHAEPAFAEKHEPVKIEAPTAPATPTVPTAEDQLAQCRAMLEEIAPLARARAAQLFPTKEPAR